MRIQASQSCLIIVDIQERLAPVMAEPRKVIEGGARLAAAARRLEIPTLISEQYPKGLGPTMIDIREVVPEVETYIEKTAFSCMGEPAFADALGSFERPQAVVAGIEMHVCVMQTALDLKEKGFEVFVVVDASGSRNAIDEDIAKARFIAAGIHLVTIEMVIFEWLARAGTPEFKEISKTLIH